MNFFRKISTTTAKVAFIVLGIGSEAESKDQLFAGGGDILLQVVPSLAEDTSELHLFSPEPRYIATNRDTAGVINLGSFALGTELIFGIFVRKTGNTFLMGSDSDTPDGIPRAVVEFLRPGVALVGFEDV